MYFNKSRIQPLDYFMCLNRPFEFNGISPTSMREHLSNMDKCSSAGSTQIPSRVFVHCADQLRIPLCILFNKCIELNRFPDVLKLAQITPIYKGKGEKNDPDNYRPISILSPIAKLFEKILCEQLYDHLESNYLLRPEQHGFRQRLSCETALNDVSEFWRSNIDICKCVISAFLDLKKAFDTVDHDILLFKLHYYHIHPDAIRLISSYLLNRSYQVCLMSANSDKLKLTTGVPQGSSLGPLFFLIYINDAVLENGQTNSKCIQLILFADDTTISAAGDDFNSTANLLSQELNRIEKWLCHNRLLINWSKTNFMIIQSNMDEGPKKLSIGSNTIDRIDKTKLLGVEIDYMLK